MAVQNSAEQYDLVQNWLRKTSPNKHCSATFCTAVFCTAVFSESIWTRKTWLYETWLDNTWLTKTGFLVPTLFISWNSWIKVGLDLDLIPLEFRVISHVIHNLIKYYSPYQSECNNIITLFIMNVIYILVITLALIVEIGTILFDDSGLQIDTELPNLENILCRGCGGDVSSAHFIISKLSPSSLYAFNDTLFNKEVVLVQVVSSDFIFQFPVITFTQSICQGFGEWQVDDSWFPGYRWRPCICPDCGAFLGWVFESVSLGSVNTPHEIFCLILTSLIGESCNYTLAFYYGLCGEWYCCCKNVYVEERSGVMFVCVQIYLKSFHHILLNKYQFYLLWW